MLLLWKREEGILFSHLKNNWIWYLSGIVISIFIIGLIWSVIKIRKKKIKKKPEKSFIKKEVKKISGVKIGKPKKYQ